MSIETPTNGDVPVESQQQEQQNGQTDVHGLENGIAGMKVDAQASVNGQNEQTNGAPVPEIELHRACVNGNVEEVRSVLSRGLESLELLDSATGCTPIVLAIRSGNIDVVRELLSAGAIVPPPGLTADPNMLALLYPPHIYGPPHIPFNGGMPMGGPEYFNGPNGFYPSEHNAPFPRRDSQNGAASQANLPPAEVSKTIPCRNFPNCKYGNGCVFFHPAQPAGPGFFPGPAPMRNGFVPGFEGYPQPGFQNGPYFVHNRFGSFPPPPVDGQSPVNGENGEESSAGESKGQTPDLASSVPIPVSQPPSAVAPVFVPQFAPAHLGSPPPPAQFGLSPLSPSMLAGSLPSIPPAEAFFAQSPPHAFPPPGPYNPRRQSFGQPFANGPKPFHSKKPSFSNGGAPRPFRGSAGPNPNLGQWKDGAPPPCAFFAQGKCRNGEYCKFPHLDADNKDVRHPDVVRGVIAPLPSLGRQNRAMRMSLPNGQFGFDASYRQQQFPQPNGSAATILEGEVDTSVPTVEVNGKAASQEDEEKTNEDQAQAAKPAAPLPAVVRSASQPGVQRVHANGFSSRSHSPAGSNASFHGNGHPRRGGARVPFPNGQRTTSQGEARQQQRVPGADEFPALGGGATSPVLNGGEKKEGKTAAQVLSAPAPYRPKAVPEAVAGNDVEGQSSKSEGSVSMEDESDTDVVIVSHKPSPAPTPSVAATAAATTRGPVSFASVISAVSETTPVSVQASA